MQYELLQRNLDFIKNKYQKVKLIILNETLIWLYIGKYVHQIDTTQSSVVTTFPSYSDRRVTI